MIKVRQQHRRVTCCNCAPLLLRSLPMRAIFKTLIILLACWFACGAAKISDNSQTSRNQVENNSIIFLDFEFEDEQIRRNLS